MTRRLLLIPALLAAWAGVACAEPSSQVAWTPETLALVKKADSSRGKSLAGSLGCDGCHAGNAMPTVPSLSGQLATYLYRQLHDYKDNSRPNGTMSAMTATLSEQGMADLAAWYAKQDAPDATEAKGNTDAAERLASQGDNQRLIPACAACHGGSGEGKAQDIPRLAGQKAAYLAATLQAYKTGQRHNDVYRRMRDIAGSLSEEEIRQLAEYYAGLD